MVDSIFEGSHGEKILGQEIYTSEDLDRDREARRRLVQGRKVKVERRDGDFEGPVDPRVAWLINEVKRIKQLKTERFIPAWILFPEEQELERFEAREKMKRWKARAEASIHDKLDEIGVTHHPHIFPRKGFLERVKSMFDLK